MRLAQQARPGAQNNHQNIAYAYVYVNSLVVTLRIIGNVKPGQSLLPNNSIVLQESQAKSIADFVVYFTGNLTGGVRPTRQLWRDGEGEPGGTSLSEHTFKKKLKLRLLDYYKQ